MRPQIGARPGSSAAFSSRPQDRIRNGTPGSGRRPGPAHRHRASALCLVCPGVARAARGAARSARRLADMTRVRPGQPGPLAELPPAGTTRQVRRLASPQTSLLRPRHPVPGWAVVSAGLSPVVATGGWLIAGALQPASCSPIRKTVSVLAGHAGTDRWIMTAALFLVGGCQFVTAAGLAGARARARILLAITGLSSIGIAVSPEPVRGSTPQHLAWTALGAAALAVWPAFAARRGPPRPLILSSHGCAAVTAVFIALLGWLIIETQGGSDLGLAERLFLSTETCWPFIVATALRHTTRPRPDPGHPILAAIRSRHNQQAPGELRKRGLPLPAWRDPPKGEEFPDGTDTQEVREGLPGQRGAAGPGDGQADRAGGPGPGGQ
jgi:Protein of unknown function (DUF998)